MTDITINPDTWPGWARFALSVACVAASGAVGAFGGLMLGAFLLTR